MPGDRIRFGVIGYGLFGAHHARAIARTDGAQLVAIAVPSERSQAAARLDQPDVALYADHRELLARQDIDIVSVVVPNTLHYAVGRAVLAAGKHLLLEKPMALELAHCRELVELAESKSRLLAIGHELRLSSLWGGVKQLIDDGAIGEPQYVLVELSRFPYRQGSAGWRYDLSQVGSWILEEPIHFFDLARWYLSGCGAPESIYARANSRQTDHPELNDNFTAVVNFPRGAYAVITQTLSAFGHHQTAKISGTRGTIWAAWSGADARAEKASFSLRYGLGSDVHEIALTKPAGELLELADEYAAVVRALREGTSPPCTGEDGLWSTKLCLAAQASVSAGTVIQISDEKHYAVPVPSG